MSRWRSSSCLLVDDADARAQAALTARQPESGAGLRSLTLFRRVRPPLVNQQPFLDGQPAAESGKGAVRAHDAMSRDDNTERVGANRLPDGARRLWPSDGVGNVTVRPHLAGGNLSEGLPDGALEVRPAVHVQRA